MKNIMYEAGPDQLWVGPKNNQILLTRGVATPVDDAIAKSLLTKPLFKEGKAVSTLDPGPRTPNPASKKEV
jgi:hypothetical protein